MEKGQKICKKKPRKFLWWSLTTSLAVFISRSQAGAQISANLN